MNAMADPEILLSIRNLVCEFPSRRRCGLGAAPPPLRAVDNVNIDIPRGCAFALVGESGSGKTTLACAAARITRPTSGMLQFDGTDVARVEGATLRQYRRDVQYVFQDSSAALDPRMSVANLISEPLRVNWQKQSAANRDRIAELLETVGLQPDLATRRTYELSGGQRQRVALARAIASRPQMLILDEPVSALDVSVRAQIVNLLETLRADHGLSYLMIVHDLVLASAFADQVAVMYRGRIVESGLGAMVFSHPQHEYTQRLAAATPTLAAIRSGRVKQS